MFPTNIAGSSHLLSKRGATPPKERCLFWHAEVTLRSEVPSRHYQQGASLF